MTSETGKISELLHLASQGDEDALSQLFSHFRERLKRMIRIRMNRRLQGRIDDSDILQEAYIEISRQFSDYVHSSSMPFFLWLRHITSQKLIEIHRRHLGAQMRDAGREVSLHRGSFPPANSASLAAQLLGRLTSPSQVAIKAEMRIRLQEALNGMDTIDREVLALRHFEQLSNRETADVLEIDESAASNRYVRSLKRLRKILESTPGFIQE